MNHEFAGYANYRRYNDPDKVDEARNGVNR